MEVWGEFSVILFIDVDENIYMCPLAKALQGNKLRMEEQTLCLTGKEAPHIHCTGKVAIVGMYTTPGIICTNSYLSPMAQGLATISFSCTTLMHTQISALITPRQSVLKGGHSAAEWNAQ